MRNILFDVDGVVMDGWHINPKRRKPWNVTIEQDLGIDKKAFETFFVPHRMGKTIKGETPLLEVMRSFLAEIGYKGKAEEVIAYWLNHDNQLNPTMIDVVKKLKQSNRVRLFLATNQEHMRAHHLWHTLRLKDLFEDIFYAADLGAAKPERQFFNQCNARLPAWGKDNPPLFFDDDPTYIEGAKAAGWEGIVFNNSEDCTEHPFIKGIMNF